MYGFLIVDKPLGITSNDVVMRVKRILRPLLGSGKVGHTGTLDPEASGVLPIALGEATKAIHYLGDKDKTYEFNIRFGASTTTDDASGEVVETTDVRPGRGDIELVFPQFTGSIMQIPPRFSALRINGRRAYDLAREGAEFELKPRPQYVYSLQLLEFLQDEARFEVKADAGFYVRSLARDIAEAVGTIGHVSYLRRTKAGAFGIDMAISLDKLVKIVNNEPADVRNFVVDISAGLDDIPVLSIPDTDLRLGRTIKYDTAPGLYQIHSNNQISLLAESKDGLLWPKRIFNL